MKDDFDPEFTAPTDVEYYNKKLSDNNSLTLSYDFKKNNFGDSRAANTCYPSFLFIEGKYLRLNTIADFDCYEDYPGLTKVTINITVNYNVHNHNADSVNGNTYTWIIKPGQLRALNLEYENPDYKDSDNGGSSNIDVDPDKETKNDKKENNNASTKEQDEQAFKFVLILTGLFFALLFVIIFFRKKLNL